MTTNQTSVKMEPWTNTKRNMKTYADNYENQAFGIMQEGIQNAADACRGDYPNLVIRINVDVDDRTLRFEDNGPGMPHCNECVWGIVSMNPATACQNQDCPWGVYHSYSNSGKQGDELGSRGMGKSLQLLAGSTTYVQTKLADGRWATSEWTIGKTVQWERTHGKDDERESKTGTTILTEGLHDKVLHDLSDIDKMTKEIGYRWFALINRGATITYVVKKNNNKVRRIVSSPKWPEVDTEHGQGRMAFKILTVKDIGALHNVDICIAQEPFDENDTRWGIAIVKNGVQTIVPFREFGLENKGVERRLFGEATYYPGSKTAFLAEAEAPSHTRFNQSDPHYIAMRRELRSAIAKLAEPYLLKPKNYVHANAESKRLSEILAKTLSKFPEFQAIFGVKQATEPSQPQVLPPKTHIYISHVDIPNVQYDAGDEIPVRVFIRNPTKEQAVRVKIEHFDCSLPPTKLSVHEEPVIARTGTVEQPKTIEVGWTTKVAKQHLAGRHHFKATLLDVKGEPILDDDEKPITKGHFVWCMEEPPVQTKTPTNTRPGGGFPHLKTQFWDDSLRKQLGNVELTFDVGSHTIYVDENSWRMRFYDSLPQKQRWGIIGDIVSAFFIRKIREMKLSEKENWTETDILALEDFLHQQRLQILREWTSCTEGGLENE